MNSLSTMRPPGTSPTAAFRLSQRARRIIPAILILRSAAVCKAPAAARGAHNRLGLCGRAAAGRDDTAALRVKMRIAAHHPPEPGDLAGHGGGAGGVCHARKDSAARGGRRSRRQHGNRGDEQSATPPWRSFKTQKFVTARVRNYSPSAWRNSGCVCWRMLVMRARSSSPR